MCAELQDSYAAAVAMGKCSASDSSGAWDNFAVSDNSSVGRAVSRAVARVVRDGCCCAYLPKKLR